MRENNILKEFKFEDLRTNPKWISVTGEQTQSHTDLGRLRLGKVGGQVS